MVFTIGSLQSRQVPKQAHANKKSLPPSPLNPFRLERKPQRLAIRPAASQDEFIKWDDADEVLDQTPLPKNPEAVAPVNRLNKGYYPAQTPLMMAIHQNDFKTARQIL